MYLIKSNKAGIYFEILLVCFICYGIIYHRITKITQILTSGPDSQIVSSNPSHGGDSNLLEEIIDLKYKPPHTCNTKIEVYKSHDSR